MRRCRVIAFSGIFSALLVYFGLLGLRLIRLAHDSPKLSGAYSVGFLGNGTLSNCIHSIAEGRGHVLEAGAEQLDIAAEPYRISSGFSSLQQCVGLLSREVSTLVRNASWAEARHSGLKAWMRMN